MPIALEPRRFFLDRFALDERALEDTIGTAIARQADFADLYFEFRTSEAFVLEEGIVKKAAKNVSQGAGVRVVAGDKTGCAHTDDVSVDTLRLASQTAQTIADGSGRQAPVAVSAARPTHDLYTLAQAPLEVGLADKIALLNEIDVAARRHDPRITNVMASIGVEQKIVLIVTSSGVVVGDVQPLVRPLSFGRPLALLHCDPLFGFFHKNGQLTSGAFNCLNDCGDLF